ncbi:putative peptidoglycan binding protein [Micromonospora sp. Llam0]|nr:putative peptidoglycan binding protein [Micromonospora sp. Llam0]
MVLSTLVKSPAQHLAETAPPTPSLLTATVQERVLATTMVTRGTVVATHLLEVTPVAAQGADALVVTGVHTSVGAPVTPGSVLVEVSGRPLIALPGSVPAYRDLRPGDEGDDVAQLQSALQELSYYSGAVDGHFGAATKNAVARLYGQLGYRMPETGGVNGVEERDALRAAEDAVEEAQREVDNLQRVIDSRSESAETPQPTEEPLEVQMEYLQKQLDDATMNLEELIARTGPMMPRNEVVFVPAFPARTTALGAEVGDQVESALVMISAGELEILAQFAPDQSELLANDMGVEIYSEILGLTASATIGSIGEVTIDGATDQASGGGSGAPYVPLNVVPDEPLEAAWAGQDVRLTITAAQTDGPVLVVPISAVTASANGRTTVSRVDVGESVVPVEVNAGASADGWVQIRPIDGELAAGDRVVVGEAARDMASDGA